jgi:OOP family OmpA-OmpF porin
MRAKTIIAALFLLLLLAGPGQVEARAGNGLGGEAGFFLGALFPDEDVAVQSDPSTEFTVGARAGVAFARHWSWFVDGTHAKIDSDTRFGTADELTGRMGFEYLFRPYGRYGWFVNAGAGWINFDYENGGAMDFHRPLGSVGTGQSIRWGATKRIRWEWRGDFTLDDARLQGASVFQGRFVVGLTWGAPRPTRGSTGATAAAATSSDLDGDGVGNRKDICPSTPAGAVVDKLGCPSDSDHDWVYDGIDRCPGTPPKTRVDEVGCIADGDADGVHDGSDACPRTPAGAVVDDWGCAEDRDGDGVPDGLDRCPHTPSDASVDESGCPSDGDGDGVFDGLDRCPDTPAGTAVDRRGCPEN